MQIVHADLAVNATPFNEALRQGGAAHIWNLTTLAGRAALDLEIQRQAAIIAYADDFKFMMFLALAALPLTLLLRRPVAAPEAEAVHAAMD